MARLTAWLDVSDGMTQHSGRRFFIASSLHRTYYHLVLHQCQVHRVYAHYLLGVVFVSGMYQDSDSGSKLKYAARPVTMFVMNNM